MSYSRAAATSAPCAPAASASAPACSMCSPMGTGSPTWARAPSRANSPPIVSAAVTEQQGNVACHRPGRAPSLRHSGRSNEPPGAEQISPARKVGYTCCKLTILAAVRLTQRIVVIGGGVLGTMHAVAARRRGYQVVHLEREGEARGASVRNFGLIWVSGRRPGAELTLALRARELWAELGAALPGLCFRPAGSLTLATDDAELRVLKEAATLPDAVQRDFELLDPGAVRAVNPALRGDLAGGLLCRADAIVEPRLALPALRGNLAGPGYEWLPGREVTEIVPN